MRIKVNGKQDTEVLTLGVQTNKGCVEMTAHYKAKRWAPGKAKAYTITSLVHTDYHGRPAAAETGYATFTVAYFTATKEGEHVIPPGKRDRDWGMKQYRELRDAAYAVSVQRGLI